jgi:HK97 gp10 family phage protein
MEVRIKVRGQQDVIRNLKDYEKGAVRTIGLAMAQILVRIQMEAKRNAPVDTGHLRDTIDTELTQSRSGFRGRVISKAYYSLFQEFGTSHGIRPKFYMSNALTSNEMFIKLRLGKAMKKAGIGFRSR